MLKLIFNQQQSESLLIATAGVMDAEMYLLLFNDKETATPFDAEMSS